jgi:cell division protein FtsI (penicillin-binding protein 3)
MMRAYAAIANGGYLVKPTLLKSEKSQLIPENKVLSDKTAADMTKMLIGVVNEGTGDGARIPHYEIAGKTGTASYYSQALQKYSGYVASFVGMAPADKPELVISVVLERPVNGHYGGEVAAPVFKKVMTFALQRMRIVPTGKLTSRLPLDW